jgi:predicted RNA methylase
MRIAHDCIARPAAAAYQAAALRAAAAAAAAAQDIEPFAQPKVQLEQYPTGADIASRMLYTVSWLRFVGTGVAAAESSAGQAAMAATRMPVSSRSC